MLEIIAQRQVTTRKEHQCWGCARVFPPGAELDVVVSTDLGRAMSTYWCKTCREYLLRHSEFFMPDDDAGSCGELKHEDEEGWEAVRQDMEEKP